MPLSENERDELLIRMDERTARLIKAVEGNGQPGLLADVAVLKEQVADIDKRAPSQKEKVGAWGSIAATAIVVIVTAAKTIFGI
jgi:hypothetical protein